MILSLGKCLEVCRVFGHGKSDHKVLNLKQRIERMTEQICIRNGTALKLRNDEVVEGKNDAGEEGEEEARLVTARVDLASPSVFRDEIQQHDRI